MTETRVQRLNGEAMERNEVLQRLDEYAADCEKQIIDCGSDWLKIAYHQRLLTFRAAAEIIRESGWRPIAEAPGNEWATYGKWVLRRVTFVWEEFHTTNKELAIDSGFTHYLLKPAPPAREMFNDGE